MEISELMQRYGLNSRQSLYARLKSLELVLEKGSRNKVHATVEQVALLDELDEHLKNGGSMKSFLPPTETVAMSQIPEILSDETDFQSPEVSMMEALVGAIATNIQPRSPLWYHFELEKAAAAGWLLTSKEVRELIGVKPKCPKGLDTFTRGSWQFFKSGNIGPSIAWRVERIY